MTMTRNEFLRSVIGVGIGATAAAALVGCGGDDGGGDGGDDAPMECTSDPDTAISGNHGHPVVVVPFADVQAGAEKTYALADGSAGHSHSITITAAQFGSIMNGNTINVTSTSGGGHTHGVTVMCVG